MRLPARTQWPSVRSVTRIEVVEPVGDDFELLPKIDVESPDRNEGGTALRVESISRGGAAWIGSVFGLVIGLFFALFLTWDRSGTSELVYPAAMVAGAVAGAWMSIAFARHFNCSECGHIVRSRDTLCRGCGATAGAKATETEFRRHRAEELDREVTDQEWEDCGECQPESPCPAHRATADIDAEWLSNG